MAFDIICLSHLGWDPTLFQRPQQVMLRLAERGHRVLYAGCVGMRPARELKRRPQVTPVPGRIAVEHLPYHPLVRRLELPRRVMAAGVVARAARALFAPVEERRVVWLYHPGLLPLALRLGGGLLVFDMMDRFRSFSASAAGTDELERRMVRAADVLFSGGRTLNTACTALLDAGSRVHPVCLPSGVDLGLFGAAMEDATPVPNVLAALPRPVFGYAGAVDERMDWRMILALARARPSASVVLVGPVLDPDPPPLPANVHTVGARPYGELPGWLKGFDVCLIPFRATELVAHVSPTKTPEYLAAGRPVVSTAIPDVEADWGDLVSLTRGPDEFVAACDAALAMPRPPGVLAAATAARARTWEGVAEEMERALEAAS